MASDESGNVLIVGSVNVDLVVRVRSLPTAGQTVVGGTFARHPGGKGANQAVAAAQMGANVTFVGAVGDDELGASALAGLAGPIAAGRSLSAQTGAPIVVTLGAAGAIVVERDLVIEIPRPQCRTGRRDRRRRHVRRRVGG